jgi:hypothetical protein
MRNLPVPLPSFLAQPCRMPPLLVTIIDAARLLGISRADTLALVNLKHLCRVEIDIDGQRQARITMASIVGYVDRLAGKEPAATGTAGKSMINDDEQTRAACRPPDNESGGLDATLRYADEAQRSNFTKYRVTAAGSDATRIRSSAAPAP